MSSQLVSIKYYKYKFTYFNEQYFHVIAGQNKQDAKMRIRERHGLQKLPNGYCLYEVSEAEFDSLSDASFQALIDRKARQEAILKKYEYDNVGSTKSEPNKWRKLYDVIMNYRLF